MFRNEKGIALVTALMFTMISLGIVMLLLSSIIQGTKLTAASKAYKNSLEASFGGVELIAKNILPALYGGTTEASLVAALAGVDFQVPSGSCFTQKWSNSTLDWASCDADNKTPDPKLAPDMTFTLKATTDAVGFKVYSKVVDTRCGGNTSVGQPCSNSDSTGIDYLDGGGGVTSSTGSVTPQHRPAYYRIEVQGERAANPREKSQLSVLYAY
jgi:hypothetical protein